MNNILFFDSDCLICNRFIQFIINHDLNREIFFSDFNSQVAKNHQLDMSKGMVFWSNGKFYFGAQAFQKIMKSIHFSRILDFLLTITPNKIQDFFYNIIMKNRNIFNNSTKSCFLKDERFIN